MLDIKICQQARVSRDPRFDGKFFIGVKTTGIFCRTVCPARLPLEKNVHYFANAAAALRAGFRPCLRCHPDALPHSYEWNSKNYFLSQVIRLIESGELPDKKLYQLCAELNITTRYLHKLFVNQFGLSPKKYEIYHKCFLAKQLIQQTGLPIGEVAMACGFSSISLFNNTFKRYLKITPTNLRTQHKSENSQQIKLKLNYQPPYSWDSFLNFQRQRLIPGLESIESGVYRRNISYKNAKGHFSVKQNSAKNYFDLTLELDDWHVLPAVLVNIRRMLDIDTNLAQIEAKFKEKLPAFALQSGLRLPGVWNVFEAGVRAICGQQISVGAATKLVGEIVRLAGTPTHNGGYYFPNAKQLAEFDFSQLKTTGRRKKTLELFSHYCCSSDDYLNPDNWLTINGIGEWTVNYAKLRGLNAPDIWLASDLGIKNALAAYERPINSEACRPWRSYLALQLWSNANV